MGRGYKNSEVRNRKSLDCPEEIFGRNMDIKGSSGEGPDRLRSTKEKASIVLENTCITMINAGRNECQRYSN